MFEDIDAKDNVVLRLLDLDLLEVHDAMLVGIGTTPSLGLQYVDADHVGGSKRCSPALLSKTLKTRSRGRMESRNSSARVCSTSPGSDSVSVGALSRRARAYKRAYALATRGCFIGVCRGRPFST